MKRAETTGAGKPLKLTSGLPIPGAPTHGALVKTLYAGVCHSDVHMNDSPDRIEVLKAAGMFPSAVLFIVLLVC